MCKLWGTEKAWEIVNDAVQVRGGRGFETAASLKARGEEPVPVERFLRDSRINTLFEGSSEIMRLFIAREALDPHLKVSAAALNTRLPLLQRAQCALKAGIFYLAWYPRQWMPFQDWTAVRRKRRSQDRQSPLLTRHLRFAGRMSRKLARALFHSMLRYGPKLEREQLLLGRLVDIGAEIFAITATCLRAEQQLSSGEKSEADNLLQLVDFFCRSSKLRIEALFGGLRQNADHSGYRLAQQVLANQDLHLEAGIVSRKD
jgi:hypothetical protein